MIHHHNSTNPRWETYLLVSTEEIEFFCIPISHPVLRSFNPDWLVNSLITVVCEEFF